MQTPPDALIQDALIVERIEFGPNCFAVKTYKACVYPRQIRLRPHRRRTRFGVVPILIQGDVFRIRFGEPPLRKVAGRPDLDEL